MIEPPLLALLMPPVGTSPLTEASLLAARGTAIALSAIAVRADEENRVTMMAQANSLPENYFAVNRRHASSQAALDNREVSWQVRTSSVWFYLTKVAEPGTLAL